MKSIMWTTSFLKPDFHMSGKSQTIGDFVISLSSQTFPIQGDNGRQLRRRVFISRECFLVTDFSVTLFSSWVLNPEH